MWSAESAEASLTCAEAASFGVAQSARIADPCGMSASGPGAFGRPLTRRETLIGLAASAASAGARAEPASRLAKALPDGSVIPALGMGTWLTFDVGASTAARESRQKVLSAFFDAGGQAIDSSPMYGSSQEVVGACLGNLPDAPVFAADKVWTRGREAGAAQIETSRRRWGVVRFDLLQVHNLVDWETQLETLFAMKAAGRLRFVGVTSYAGISYEAIAAIMGARPIDFVQITYNIIDRAAETRILPLAAEKGIAVIANRPFREGALVDRFARERLPALAAEIGAASWPQYLLKFIVAHPAVTLAIPATRRVDHMRENMGALEGPVPDAAQRREMIKAVAAL